MRPFISEKIRDVLNQDHSLNVYKIIGSLVEFDKTYVAFVYWKTDRELNMITDDIKRKIKHIFLNYLKNNGYFPNEVQDVILYFDSDENVQKNYKGNYFYATR